MRRVALLLLALACAACRSGEPPVWFIHATDPHLFDRADNAPKLSEEQLSQQAFADLLRVAGELPETGDRPSFLVLTGDFGADGVVSLWPPEGETAPEAVLADLLAASPVRDIYFVPGNNDVVCESEQPEAMEAMRGFFERTGGLLGNRVVLHDLTSCYYLPGTSCEVDVPGTKIRLIGFPTHSFKNSETPESFEINQPIQEAHVDLLAALVKRAGAEGRKVLILTHIAELDDPYKKAKGSSSEEKRPSYQPKYSPWNVSLEVQQRWKDIVNSRVVAGVLAGHFHDPRREIYDPPYRRSDAAEDRADPAKVQLTPPLSVRYQATSPRQARGFALVRLEGGRVSRRMFWYDPEQRHFRPDPLRSPS